MKKIIMMTAALCMTAAGAAMAQDATGPEYKTVTGAENPAAVPPANVPAEQVEQVEKPDVAKLPSEGMPVQATVVVPAARDAITNEVVPAEVPLNDEPKSLRDRVRSRMNDDR